MFLLLTVALTYLGLHAHPHVLRVPLFWAAFSFLLVAGAYALNRPCPFMRMRRGRANFIGWGAFWPYFGLKQLTFTFGRLTTREAPFNEIVPGLYLGRLLTAREAAEKLPFRLAGVVDLMCELPESAPLRHRAIYLSLPVLEGMPPKLEQLREGAAWIAQRLAAGPVYVHCAMGHGRSGTMVVAALLASGRVKTVEEGIAMVQGKRPGAKIQRSQMKVLREFAEQIRTRSDLGAV
jgi:hypothetical protein